MVFDINEFLQAISNVLDVIETDIFGVPTNHSKRLACVTNRLAHALNFSTDMKYDLAALSILHDNGASLKILHDNLRGDAKAKQNIIESSKEHCRIGESNIISFPFLTSPKNVILYHHEKLNGMGYPRGLGADQLDFNSRLLACLDIYQALGEIRPYREAMTHDESIKIMRRMVEDGLIDPEITEDIAQQLKTNN